MTCRAIVVIGLALRILCTPTACFTAEPSTETRRPNIVLILADDLGRHDCGFMGGTEIKTPHLDKLAHAGTILDSFYVQPVCSPTRAALLTGRYPMRHGLQVGVVRPWAQYGLPLDERTLPQALHDAGYATAIIGKWHLGHYRPEYLPTRRGFDHQYGHYNGAIDYFTHIRDGGFDWHRDDQVCRDEGYSTELLGNAAADFVATTAGKQSFFLYVPFNAVHTPLQVPDKYLEPYAHLQGRRRTYAGMVAAMDAAVGQIVAAVDEAGARQNTLFIFASDNGGPQPGVVTDNGRYRAGKGTLYEGGVRVAAFATWDGHLAAGTSLAEPLHAVDWHPTLLKLCGAATEQPTAVDGLDIWPTLSAGQPSPHDAILLNTTPNDGALRMGNWKLIVRQRAGRRRARETDTGTMQTTELYHLANDPYETTNVAEQHAEKVKQLQDRLDAFAAQAVPPKLRPKPADFGAPPIWGE